MPSALWELSLQTGEAGGCHASRSTERCSALSSCSSMRRTQAEVWPILEHHEPLPSLGNAVVRVTTSVACAQRVVLQLVSSTSKVIPQDLYTRFGCGSLSRANAGSGRNCRPDFFKIFCLGRTRKKHMTMHPTYGGLEANTTSSRGAKWVH